MVFQLRYDVLRIECHFLQLVSAETQVISRLQHCRLDLANNVFGNDRISTNHKVKD